MPRGFFGGHDDGDGNYEEDEDEDEDHRKEDPYKATATLEIVSLQSEDSRSMSPKKNSSTSSRRRYSQTPADPWHSANLFRAQRGVPR